MLTVIILLFALTAVALYLRKELKLRNEQSSEIITTPPQGQPEPTETPVPESLPIPTQPKVADKTEEAKKRKYNKNPKKMDANKTA